MANTKSDRWITRLVALVNASPTAKLSACSVCDP